MNQSFSEFIDSEINAIIPHPFRDPHLFNEDCSAGLMLATDDRVSLQKFAIASIALAQFLGARALIEAMLLRFGRVLPRGPEADSLILKIYEMADLVAENSRQHYIELPWVGAHYFARWRLRHHEAARLSEDGTLRAPAVLSAARHATFAYEAEPAVAANADRIVEQLAFVFDNYAIGLRQHFGSDNLLRAAGPSPLRSNPDYR
jgi:hypothetical protein